MIGKDDALQMAEEYIRCEIDTENPNHLIRIKKISNIVYLNFLFYPFTVEYFS